MEWEVNSKRQQELVQDIREKFVPRRGIHLTDLTLCLRKAYFRKQGMAPPITERQCMFYIAGLAIQDYLLEPYNVTTQKDGIICSPDFCSVKGLEEVKSTRMSSHKFDPEDITHWKRQILGYMEALEVTEANLVVFFIIEASLQVWSAKATEEEIEANWEWLLERKIELENAIARMQLPPYPDAEERWQCRNCECAELCPDSPGTGRRKLPRTEARTW